MTPEQQRIAIAEACGYTRRPCEWENFVAWHDPEGNYLPPIQHVRRDADSQAALLPDYLNDLNAMHEAEKVLTTEQYADEFIYHLGCVFADNGLYVIAKAVHATASQRAEAFLRTLNLWTL